MHAITRAVRPVPRGLADRWGRLNRRRKIVVGAIAIPLLALCPCLCVASLVPGSPTVTPTATVIPVTPTAAATPTVAASPSATGNRIPAAAATPRPSATSTATTRPTASPSPQAEATATARPTSSPAPTAEMVPPTPIPTPPQGAADVKIVAIHYDGAVAVVESDEYAVIANRGTAPANLRGWRLNAGDPKQNFTFPDYVLAPGSDCRVYTNELHAESGGFSFGSGKPVWANNRDCGYLYDEGGNEVSRYCY